MLILGINFFMNPDNKILLLLFHSTVVLTESLAKMCSLSLEGRLLRALPTLDFCCSHIGLHETSVSAGRGSSQPAWVSVFPEGCLVQLGTPSVFMLYLFRIVHTRFLFSTKVGLYGNSSYPWKDCSLHSRSGILYIFHRSCVVKVTWGHAMNIGKLRSWFDLFLWATLVFPVISWPSAPRASVVSDLQVLQFVFLPSIFLPETLALCLAGYGTVPCAVCVPPLAAERHKQMGQLSEFVSDNWNGNWNALIYA